MQWFFLKCLLPVDEWIEWNVMCGYDLLRMSELAWLEWEVEPLLKKNTDQTLFGTPISTCFAKVNGDTAISIYMLSWSMYTYVPLVFMMLLFMMNTNYAKLCILSHIGKLNQPSHIIIVSTICTSSPKRWEVSNHRNGYNISVWLWSSHEQSKETELAFNQINKNCGFWWTNYIWLEKAQDILLSS